MYSNDIFFCIEEEMKAIRAGPRKLEFDPTTGKLRVIR